MKQGGQAFTRGLHAIVHDSLELHRNFKHVQDLQEDKAQSRNTYLQSNASAMGHLITETLARKCRIREKQQSRERIAVRFKPVRLLAILTCASFTPTRVVADLTESRQFFISAVLCSSRCEQVSRR